MGLKLRVISEHYLALGPFRSWRFDTEGGSIGRAPDNDWILPDRNRYISRYHCTVSRRAGAWLLADTSKNGVFLNDDTEPLSSRGICTLRDGDRLSMGDYEVLISIDEDPGTQDEKTQTSHATAGIRDPSASLTEELHASRGDRKDLRSLLDEESLRLRATTGAGQRAPAATLTPSAAIATQTAYAADHGDAASDSALHEEITLGTVADPDESDTAAAKRPVAPGPPQAQESPEFAAADPATRRALSEAITFRVIPGGQAAEPSPGPDSGSRSAAQAEGSSYAVSSDERRTLNALLDEITFAAAPAWREVPDGSPESPRPIELEQWPLQSPCVTDSDNTSRQLAAEQSADAQSLRALIEEVTLVVVPDLGSFGSPPGSAVAREQHGASASGSRSGLATGPAPSMAAPDPAQHRPAGGTHDSPPARTRLSVDSPQSPASEARGHTDDHPKPADAGFEAFCRGAGVDPERVLAEERGAFLSRAGHMLREATAGIMDALHTRSEVKTTLQLDQTISERAANNPLKFLDNVNDVLLALLNEPAPRHLGPAEACREALADLNMHQLAVLAAIRGALAGLLDRLEPGELEGRFDQALSRDDVPRSMRKLRYWELYCELYRRVVSAGTEGLPTAFLQEFGRSYEQKACDLLGRRRAG